jgi:hypothetical protein
MSLLMLILRRTLLNVLFVTFSLLAACGGGGGSSSSSGTGSSSTSGGGSSSSGSSSSSGTSSGAIGVGSGTTYYVDAAGSDSNTGTTLASAFKTIGKAVSVVNPGDIVEVNAGTYTESVMITRPGSSSAWITMRAYNGGRAILKSTGAGPTVYFYHDDCDESVIGTGSGNTDCRAFYWVLQGLEIQGSPSGGGDGNTVKIDTPKVKLIGNKLCCAAADVVKIVRTANDAEVLDNEIWQNASIVTPSSNAQGVDIVGADRVRVAGNYVHDVPDIGIYAKGNARNTVFENNRLVNIGIGANGHALMLGQSTDTDRLADGTYETYDGIIRNNVVMNATWACVATSSSQNVHIYNNSCYNTGTAVHGSILLSNESEVGQAGSNIEIRNNIIYGSATHPVIKIDDNAMTDYTTLHIDHNLYYVTGGNPTFTWNTYGLDGVAVAAWQAQYASHSSHTDDSTVTDPLYANTSTSSTTPLTLQSSSPAIDNGVSTTYVTTDFAGTARPRGSAIDIGAYEY